MRALEFGVDTDSPFCDIDLNSTATGPMLPAPLERH